MKENRSFRIKNIRFVTARDLIKYLQQDKYQRLLLVYAPYVRYELPSDISPMEGTFVILNSWTYMTCERTSDILDRGDLRNWQGECFGSTKDTFVSLGSTIANAHSSHITLDDSTFNSLKGSSCRF